MKLLKILFTLFILGSVSICNSQISVTGGLTAQQLAQILCGSNISVTNATITGPASGYGSFNSSGGFPFSSGVILTNGLLSQAPGPNNDPNSSSNLGGIGTTEMNTLGGANSYDVVTLEFDFVVQSSAIQFQYIFASEEYPEFAPPNQPSFNDVFAFYISGPGITGQQNIALIPGTTSPVSIDNVNPVTYPQYYVDNTSGQAIQFDGYTTNLTAVKNGLIPCQSYHLRMVIADIQTANRNSAVFLKENSFVQDNVLGAETQTINADGIALEGCVKGSFAFQFGEISNQDRTITFSIGGTAINGVDYSYIDNSITIPAGETSGTVFIDPFSDGLTEGPETISIIYNSGICGGTDTVLLTINDAQPINFTLNGTNLDCFGDQSGEILVNATGGFPGYTYYVTDPIGNTSIHTNNPVTGLAAGQYSVQVQDTYGCQAEALVIGGQFNAGTTFLPDGSGVTYEAPLTISGFNPGQTITNISQIQQICLTMEHSYLGDLLIQVQSPSGQIITLKESNGGGSTDLGEPIATGPVDGQGSSDTTPGTGYEYCFNASPVHGTMVNESGLYNRNYTDGVGNSYSDSYLPAGSYTAFDNFSGLLGSQMNGVWKVFVTDQFGLDNGYIFNWYISLIGDLPDTTIVLTQPAQMTISGLASNATCGSSNGSINISVVNGVTPISYIWSNGATTEDISGVSAGQYSVTVTDANGCTNTKNFIVNNSGTLSLNSTITNATCFGGNNGSIAIQPSGGTAPYSFLWSNGSSTQNISGLSAGIYTATITDQSGCQFSQSLTVGQGIQISANLVSSSDEICNTNNGFLDISPLGGNGSYGYSWSNGSVTQDLSNLTSGTYSVSITDGLGCVGTSSFSISNNLTGCSNYCYLSVQPSSIVNATCGNANGSFDITVLNGVAPFTISWSNGSNTEDINGLLPGSYTVTVVGANNCSTTATYTIANNSNNFQIASVALNDEVCGFDNGSIDISVNGGVAPYSYNWSNGAQTQDLSALSAGNYSVSVTDQVGCQISSTYTITNVTGNLSVSSQISPSFCNSNNGAISQTVSGASGNVSYLWNNGATTQNISTLAPGNYSCLVTDASGCSLNNTYTVGQNSGNVQLTGTLVTNEICNNNQGAINITVSGSGLTYLWSNGSVTEDLSGLSSGNYSCTITNTQGCSISTGIISIINTAGTMVVSNQSVTNEVCNNNSGAIDVNVFNGTEPYTYLWSTGAITQDITGLSDGTYTLQITDNNGCTLSHSVVVGSSQGTLNVSLTNIIHESCISGTGTNGQGSIDISVSGSSGSYSYSWSNGATTQDITGLTDGVYTVTVNSTVGCTATQSYTVLANGSNIAVQSVSITNEVCGSGTGAINIAMDPSSGPYSYLWSNGAITEDISGLTAGTYQLTASNSFGCSVTQSFVVNNSSGTLTLVSSALTNENCGNGNGGINLTVSGGSAPISYVWSNGATTQDLIGLSAGNYSVVISDIYGCSIPYSEAIVNISNGLSLQVALVTDETCGQGNGIIDMNVTATGNVTYLWSNGQSTQDLTGLLAGNYTVTVTDQNGCSASTTVPVLNQTGSLGISFSNIQNELCGNGQGFIDIEVSGTGPFAYLWSNNTSSQDVINLSSGNYSVQVTDGIGCQLTEYFTVTNINNSQTLVSFNVINSLCNANNGSIDLTVNAGITPFTYVWSTGQSTEDLSGLSQGLYSVIITDGMNCAATFSTYVSTSNSDLAITSVDVFNDFCNSFQGGFGVNTVGSVQEFYLDGMPNGSQFIFGLGQGTYLIEVTDIYGCSVSQTASILNDAFFTLSETHVNTTCGINNGAINLSVQGGGGPGAGYTYLWSNGATTQDITNLSSGTYTVTITSSGGPNGDCSDQLSVIITNDNGFEVINQMTPDYCGQGQGGLNLTIINGSGMSYLWSNGATTEDINGLIYGDYSCTITESGGCSSTYGYSVQNATSGASVSHQVGNELCGDGSGFIDLTVSGGSGNYSFSWSNSAISEDLSGLSAGSYTVSITDQNDGCVFGSEITISNEVIAIGSGVTSDASCSSCSDGYIQLYLNGLTTFTCLWSNGDTFPAIYNLLPGNYSVQIISAEGCDTTMFFTIGVAGLGELHTGNIEMSVYPNPTIQDFTISVEIPSELQGELFLTDLTGKQIWNSSIEKSGTFNYPGSELESGVYFIKLQCGDFSKIERLVISD